ncbi:MAG: CopG family transcriptional regulator [Limisphaerales bacterium]
MMTLYDDAMRTIIELPEEQLEALGNISSREKTSRAEIIRRAVGSYIHEKQAGKGRSAFGLWKKKKINALKYESRLRAEWEK